jgi:hypothetical protein
MEQPKILMTIPYNRINSRGQYYGKDVVIKMLKEKGLGDDNIFDDQENQVIYVDILLLMENTKFVNRYLDRDDLFPLDREVN